MNELKSLRRFLIVSFIQVTIATTAAETILLIVFRNTVLKWILTALFGVSDASALGPTRLFLVLIALLAEALMSAVQFILPDRVANIAKLAAAAAERFSSKAAGLTHITEQIVNVSPFKSFLLWWGMFFSFFILIIPYVLGALYYARLVIREFRLIEERENAKKREFEKARNLMISGIAHDLRTPMTSIIGYSKALEEGIVDDEKREEVCRSIQNKSGRMNDLISLLSDYVKLDSEGFCLNREELDLCELLRECAAAVYDEIEESDVTLEMDVPEDPVVIEADKVQFERVINNLITNAVRHNEEGGYLGILMKQEDGSLDVLICDSGQPVEKERAEHIFEPFVTGDASRHSGSGLGLTIAHRIIELHGYELELIQKDEGEQIREPYNKAFRIRIRT